MGALVSVHKNKPAIEASLNVVNLVGILDQKHGNTTVTVNGRKEKRCSILPTMSCQEHFENADYAFLNGHPSVTGQVFVTAFSATGVKPNKPTQNPGGEGYVKIVDEALRKIDGKSIWKPDYDAFMVQMDAAAAAGKKDKPKEIELVRKAAQDPIVRLSQIANDRLIAINDEGLAYVAEAEQAMADNPNKAKESLKQIVRQYATLDCAKKATELLKKLEKGK